MRNQGRIAILIVLALGACAALVWLPRANESVIALLEWVESRGPWGPLLFVIIYIVGCMLFLPGSVLTIGAGFIFGLVTGTITVSIGSTLGAGAAFLLARTVLRKWVSQVIAPMPRFRALDEAVGREGFKVVLLTRLSPLFPFNLLNFMFGITKVTFWDYMLASWIGMLPGAVLYVYIGTAAHSIAAIAAGRNETTTAEKVIFGIGLAATALVMALLARLARKSLASTIPIETCAAIEPRAPNGSPDLTGKRQEWGVIDRADMK
jgi:uncharacterized membrane protein YdjX (TVP38/TMEM64 family)